MSYGSQNPWTAPQAGTTTAAVDAGLRRYLVSVYQYMALGLGITGAVAWLAASTGMTYEIFTSPVRWLVIFAPLAVVMFLSFRINQMSAAGAQLGFWIYAALVGLSISTIFLVYTDASIALTFFVAGGTFLGTSLWAYTTRADLSRFGSFLAMGLIGLVLASLVQLFLQSPALQFALSVIGVLLFTGLTAWDTQAIRAQYYAVATGEAMAKSAIIGALKLYLDFINLFLFLLQFFGNRRD